MKTIYRHPEFGQITISKTRRARRISLGVRPGPRITLSVPQRTPIRQAMEFMESKSQWLGETLARVCEKYPAKIILPPYEICSRQLFLVPSRETTFKFRIDDAGIYVHYPGYLEPRGGEVQQAVRQAVTEVLRLEAKSVLPGRVRELAELHGLRHCKVTVRNSTTRWGSCSASNDISLSLHLMRLPAELCDYVILHELCHTVHKNHSAEFYSLLDLLCGGVSDSRRRALKNYFPGVW